jgi:hypothetical protein
MLSIGEYPPTMKKKILMDKFYLYRYNTDYLRINYHIYTKPRMKN